MRRAVISAALVAGLAQSGSAGADPGSRTSGTPAASIEPARISAFVERADEPILMLPDAGSPRRGAAARGARLPVYGERPGPGCGTRWLNIGPIAWICADHAPTSRAPADIGSAAVPSDGLPYRYFFVGPNGSLGYASLATAEDVAPTSELQPGFALAVVSVAGKAPGDPFALTASGLWVPMRDLAPARPISFAGRELDDAVGTVGWVLADAARTFSKPGVASDAPRVTRFTEIEVMEQARRATTSFYRIGDGLWLDARDVTIRRPASPPPEARPGERWIDVDRTAQILTAYIGPKPVFSTLISTGKGPETTPTSTPAGTFRLWVKLLSSNMDNLEDEDAGRYYEMERVPWVMFFKEGYGLHGTYWHQGFGKVRSHGCVNLSPRDAARIFAWTTPHLPVGWTAVLPTAYEPGTLVVVR